MKVEVIEWTGMAIGKELILPDDLADVLIAQGKVKSLEETKNVKISKGSRNKSNDIDLGGSEIVVEGNEND